MERSLNSSNMSDSVSSRKWLSEECLPRGRTHSCSGSFSSRQNQNKVSPSGNTRQTEEPQSQPCLGRLGRKPLLPNRDVLFKSKLDEKSAAVPKQSHRTMLLPVCKENLHISKTDKVVSDESCLKDTKRCSEAGSNTINRSLAHFMGPRIKTALSKVFRKSTSGLKGRRVLKPLGRIAGRFPWRRRGEKSLKGSLNQNSTIKATVSCEELNQRNQFESHEHRRWHSTEALMDKSDRCVEGHQGLFGWLEEQEEATSDCESLFSLDSLSSAYAAALTECLTREDSAPSEAEGSDSEMSKDSLTLENSWKFSTVKRRKQQVVPTYSRVTTSAVSSMLNRATAEPSRDLCRSQKSVVIPAEAYLSPDARTRAQSQSALEADSVHKLIDDFRNLQTTLRKPENLLALADVWSSADTTESQRSDRDSPPLPRKILLLNAESKCRGSSPGTGNLSESQSEYRGFSSEAFNSSEINQCTDTLRESGAFAASANVLTSGKDFPTDHFEQISTTAFNPQWKSVQTSLKSGCKSPPPLFAVSAPCSLSFPSVATLNNTPDALTLLQPSIEEKALDVEVENVREFQLNYFRNPEGGSVKWEETKSKEVSVAFQQEVVKLACKNSRKRNKDHRNAFMGCLKIPKRSDSGELDTFYSAPGDSLEGVWSDNRNNSSDYKEESKSQEFNSLSADGDDGQDSVASDSWPVSDLQSIELEQSGQIFKNMSSQYDTAVGGNEFVKRGDVGVNKDFEVTERVQHDTDDDRKRAEKLRHVCRSEAICSAIDLRISEVIKERVELSGGMNKSQSLSILSSMACHFSSDCKESRWIDDQLRDERTTDVKAGKICDDVCEIITADHLGSYMPMNKTTGHKGVENPNGGNALPQKIKDEATRKDTKPPDMITSDISSNKDVDDMNSDLIPQLHTQHSSQWLYKCIHDTASSSRHTNLNGLSSKLDNVISGGEKTSGHMIQIFPSDADRSASETLIRQVKAEKGLYSQITLSPGETAEHKARGKPIRAQDRLRCQQIYPENIAQTSVVTVSPNDKRPNSRCNFAENHRMNISESYATKSDTGAGLFPIPTPIPGNLVLKKKTIKKKRFRKSDIKTRSVSPSDTSLKSSDEDDEEKEGSRRLRCRLASKCFNVGRRSNEESCTSLSTSQCKMEITEGNSGERKESSRQQSPRRHSLPPQRMETERSCLNANQCEAQHTPHCQDSPIHFESSDINPFVHQWQHGDSGQHCHKTPVFGSAADLSCKSPLLNNSEKRIVRCSSADNGLNGLNSPFNSHLSTYATNKGLSSTLSSIEDYRGRVDTQLVSPEAEAETCSQTTNGLSSSQVDEIMLVYSSEQESKMNKTQVQKRKMREHSTQTESRLGTIGSGGLKRKDRHKRSNTDVPLSQRNKVDVRKSSTWASMETMSAHLSKLIHSTSDLLGDVQGMRTGEVSKSSPRSINSPLQSLLHSDLNGRSKNDRSAQTASDIGIQTEEVGTAVSSKSAVTEALKKQSKAYEVRVTVKVIGPEDKYVHGGVKRDTSANEAIQSVPDLSVNVSVASQSHDDPLTLPCTKREASCHRRAKSASSQVSKQSTLVKLGPGNVTVASRPSRKCSQDHPRLSLTSKPTTFLKQQAAFTDRASSPILTMGPRLGPWQRGKQSMHGKPSYRNLQTSLSSKEDTFAVPPAENLKPCFHVKSDTTSRERVSEITCSSRQELDTSSSSLKSSLDVDTEILKRKESSVDEENHEACSERHNHIFPAMRQTDIPEQQESYCTGAFQDVCIDSDHLLPFSEHRNPLTEDDMVSPAQSECSTDILVNTEAATSISLWEDHQKVPDDLPMHNKFTNWSGVRHNQRPQCSSKMKTTPAEERRNCAEWAEMASTCSNLDAVAQSDRKSTEILKLRQERERVMATVNLSANVTPLTVELTEAKLHYGLGETDALLKMLSPRSKEELRPLTSTASKQQLYDR